MSESAGLTPPVDEAATELELSAQELLALANSRDVAKPEILPTDQPSRSPARPSSTNKAVSASRLFLSLLVIVGSLGTAYVLTTSDRADSSTAEIPQQTAQSEWPAPAQIAEGQAVRFANPFDTNEVFEFPPGTTLAEAREAVAEVLIERATSRQKT